MTCLSGYVAGAADFRGEQYTASDGALVRLGGVTLILCTRQHAKRLVVEVRRAEDCRIRGAGPVRVGWDERQAARSKKYLRRGQRQKQPRREASRSSAAGHRSLCTVAPWHTHRPSSDLDCSHRPKPHEPLLHIPAVHRSCWHNAVSGGIEPCSGGDRIVFGTHTSPRPHSSAAARLGAYCCHCPRANTPGGVRCVARGWRQSQG